MLSAGLVSLLAQNTHAVTQEEAKAHWDVWDESHDYLCPPLAYYQVGPNQYRSYDFNAIADTTSFFVPLCEDPQVKSSAWSQQSESGSSGHAGDSF